MLADYFGLPIEIQQFVGGWLRVPADSFCRLGVRPNTPCSATPRRSARLLAMPERFEIVVGPLSFETFMGFLPGHVDCRS